MLDASRLPLENYKRVKSEVERQELDFLLAQCKEGTELMGEETRNLFSRHPDGLVPERGHISLHCEMREK